MDGWLILKRFDGESVTATDEVTGDSGVISLKKSRDGVACLAFRFPDNFKTMRTEILKQGDAQDSGSEE